MYFKTIRIWFFKCLNAAFYNFGIICYNKYIYLFLFIYYLLYTIFNLFKDNIININ